MDNCVKGFVNSCPHLTIKVPKKVAEIRLCGGAVVFSIDEDADFIMPTEEQRKNLKEILCIDVVPFEEDSNARSK